MEASLVAAIQESLAIHVTSNAVLLAERLYGEFPSVKNLQILANAHISNQDPATAYRLLSAFVNSKAWTHHHKDQTSPEWHVSYLLGVTAAMSKRFAEAEAVLSDLEPTSAGARHWLGECGRHLNRKWAGENYLKAATLNTSLIASYEQAVKFSGTFKDKESPYDSLSSPATAGGAQHRDPAGRSSLRNPFGSGSFSRSKTPPPTKGNSGDAEYNAMLREWAMAIRQLYEYRLTDAANTLVAMEPKTGWVLSAQGFAAFHSGNTTAALGFYRQLRDREPWRLTDSGLVWMSTALWHLRLDAELGALSQLLVEETPQSPIAMTVAGNCYSLAKDHRAAIQMLQRATQADPLFAMAHALRGHEHLAMRQVQEALSAFEAGAKAEPRLYTAYAGIGDAYCRESNDFKGRRYFAMAVEINPLPSIMNRLGQTYVKAGTTENMNKAIQIFDTVLKRHPSNQGAKHHRAVTLMHLGQHAQALQELEALQREAGTEVVVVLGIADCLRALNRKSEAIHAYEKALSMDRFRAGMIKARLDQLVAGNTPAPGYNPQQQV